MNAPKVLAVALAALCVSSTARAQSPTNATTGTTPPTSTPHTDEQQAQTLSDRAYESYEKGDYSNAISLYLESYKLNPSADILYNIARIYDQKLNDRQLALEFYRRHNAAPDAKPDLVGKATARIATLQSNDASSSATPPKSSTAPEQAKSSSPWKTVGLVGAGVGGLAIVTGVVSGLVASGKHSDAKNNGCTGDICTTTTGLDAEKSAATWGNVSTVTFIVGGALVAGGLILYFTAPNNTSPEKTTARAFQIVPSVGPHEGGLMAVGRF